MVRKRKNTVLLSSDSEEEEQRQKSTRAKRSKTKSKPAKEEESEYSEELSDLEELENGDEEPDQSATTTPDDEQDALKKTTQEGLKQLLEMHMFKHFDSITVHSVKSFLNSFTADLVTHYKEVRPTIADKVKKEREKQIVAKTKSLQKIAKMESTLKSDMEFMSDPALLLHIFSYLDLSAFLQLRQCCRYFKQFIQTNYEKLFTHLPLFWSSYPTKVNRKMDKIALSIEHKNRKIFAKLCVLVQEENAISAMAAAEVEKSQKFGKFFEELFHKSALKFAPFVWLRIDRFYSVAQPKYGIATNKLNTKIAIFHALKEGDDFAIPKFDNAKKIALFVSFRIGYSLDEKIERLNKIPNHLTASIPIEVYTVQYRNETSISDKVLNQNMILYVFQPRCTLVVDKDKRIELQRPGCVISFPSTFYAESNFIIGRKQTWHSICSLHASPTFRSLFKKKHYAKTMDASQEAYAKRLYELVTMIKEN